MRPLLIAALLALPAVALAAKPEAFKGPDLSGTYACQGQDNQDGPFTSTVTLELVRDQSTKAMGAYAFRMEVPGYGSYSGQMAATGTVAAITFALKDPVPKDYGTGLARFTRAPNGKWRFTKHYYEPEFKGGNFGTEHCAQQ